MAKIKYHLFESNKEEIIQEIGKDRLIEVLKKMLLIRNFETRAESAYQHGKIGGFFHSYIGQEAIGTAAVEALGIDHWYLTTYRCHGLALLHDEPPKELMAELYGKVTGNAKGRGGSMHLFSKNLLGGFGIVGGHLPLVAGAAFSAKYQGQKDKIAIGFLGDGAVVQGTFHETLNLATLWSLPSVFVVENNQWGMGTAVSRAVCHQPIAESFAKAYGIKGYTIDGMDFFNCFACFKQVLEEVRSSSKPVLIEALTERFKGHSVSDPGLYRSKDELQKAMEKDPLHRLAGELIDAKIITQEEVDHFNQEIKQIVIDAMAFADESPLPDPLTLEEDVYA
ncbi:MAG: pyruvate dehydrogenase (acetyl-transferring) E1 component subunit alpha [Simkaniaceae bacterium]|nr:pyruvate dehydrogenase (acetyl-transferring) E1 component subunit alpha [Simkaniaceae bacterium]